MKAKPRTDTLQVWIFAELLFVTFFYVETKGPTLEEIAKIFDGDEAEVAFVDADKVGTETFATGVEKHGDVHVESVRH